MSEPSPPSTKPAAPDKGTLTELFEAEEAPLLRYAFSLIGRRAIAEELVQEVFLQLHRHWANVEKPRAWLYRSVRNRAYNHIRDNKREILTDDTGENVSKDSVEAPDEVLRRMEAAGHVRLIMEELKEEDRELVRLKYFEDLKYKEIAERTGLSVGNVGYRLHHILKQLADKLRQLGIEGSKS
ncbi:MAG: RNA polymerase sigma factor [Verrucomicrobiota bacterium]